jgi:single-strand selective monofunctional uracil DNA glycosylase
MADSERGNELIQASRRLAIACARITFHEPVRFVYNPLLYARLTHEQYILRYGTGQKRVIFLGMNPGPWGMAQTGVPFGEVSIVRDWLGIKGKIRSPAKSHPRVPIAGFDCHRSEVSGKRLWGLMQERFGSPAEFFRVHLVVNYCPLLFLNTLAHNITPDRISPSDRQPLEQRCDAHLVSVIAALKPLWLVGIGKYALSRLKAMQAREGWSHINVLGVPHPSPASPQANRDWAGTVTSSLLRAGVW